MTIEKRIAALEGRLAVVERAPAYDRPRLSFQRFGEQLKARIAESAAEDQRRATLPVDEQLRLLRADHAAEVECRGKRTEAEARLTMPNHDVLADKLFAYMEKRLLEAIGTAEA